jgi:hypothetical protein
MFVSDQGRSPQLNGRNDRRQSLKIRGVTTDTCSMAGEGPSYIHERFGTTPRWRRPNWRRCAGCGTLPAIDSVSELDAVFRQIAVCDFLADEPLLYRMVLPYGHFSIGGHRKRVVLIGVLGEDHAGRLTGAVRAHLLTLVNVRNVAFRVLETRGEVIRWHPHAA